VGSDTVEALLIQLISCWSGWETNSHYVDKLVPAIVRNDQDLNLMPSEQRTVDQLRRSLSPEQWNSLPSMVSECMDGRRTEQQRLDQEARDRPRLERERKAAERERAAAERERAAPVVARMKSLLQSDFLAVDQAHLVDPDKNLLTAQRLEELKRDFVREWVEDELDYSVDDEQAAAIATFGCDLRVTARAGSGKTRTLVTRAIFLMKHCRVPGNSLLLLVFNKKAAEEIKSRISSVALEGDPPHVMTFHALAHALVHPDETLVYDDAETDSFARSRVVQGVIDEHLIDPHYSQIIQQVMLAHFRSDWETIAEGGFDLTVSDFLARRRALPRESLNGEWVKSYGEKFIANLLFENGIAYRYEKNFKWNGRNYQPDFTIEVRPGEGVVIEYFGLKGDQDYDEQSQAKRDFWERKEGWKLLEFTPRDIAGGPDEFAAQLLGSLAGFGIIAQPRSEEEIWQLVRARAIDHFTSAIADFVSRSRKRGFSGSDLDDLIAGHLTLTPFEGSFLEVGRSVYAAYLERLPKTSQEDFDGLMWRAINSLHGGQTRFTRDQGREQGNLARMRFVLIDEFQDFTQMFLEMVDGIRSVSPDVEFFCVGDDWQAINAFAGSERRFFTNFDRYFDNSRSVEISTNYRSPVDVVRIGNDIMAGEGVPARASRKDRGSVQSCDLETFNPSAVELDRHNGDEKTPAVLRLVRRCLDLGQDVVLLTRRNRAPWYVNYDERPRRGPSGLEHFLLRLLSYLPTDDHHRVSISTVHKYKGLEKGAVIVLDAIEGSYPLIHPSWVFLRVFGDNIEQIESDERRLFYVAVTRATNSLLLITETSRISPYLMDIQQGTKPNYVDWSMLVPVPSLGSPTLEVRVFKAYEIRDELKQQGYRWNRAGEYWHKSTAADSFALQTLTGQEWCRPPVLVKVVTEDGTLLHRHLAQ